MINVVNAFLHQVVNKTLEHCCWGLHFQHYWGCDSFEKFCYFSNWNIIPRKWLSRIRERGFDIASSFLVSVLTFRILGSFGPESIVLKHRFAALQRKKMSLIDKYISR